MAKGKYREWISPDGLAKVHYWSSNGLDDKDIIHNIGISTETFYQWMSKYPEFADAVKSGRVTAVQEVENALFNLAMGRAERVTTTEYINEDGKKSIKRVTEKVPPNATAQIFFLKNKGGYSDNPNASPSEKAPVIVLGVKPRVMQK